MIFSIHSGTRMNPPVSWKSLGLSHSCGTHKKNELSFPLEVLGPVPHSQDYARHHTPHSLKRDEALSHSQGCLPGSLEGPKRAPWSGHPWATCSPSSEVPWSGHPWPTRPPSWVVPWSCLAVAPGGGDQLCGQCHGGEGAHHGDPHHGDGDVLPLVCHLRQEHGGRASAWGHSLEEPGRIPAGNDVPIPQFLRPHVSGGSPPVSAPHLLLHPPSLRLVPVLTLRLMPAPSEAGAGAPSEAGWLVCSGCSFTWA